MFSGCQAPLELLKSLSAFQDSLAVAGRRCGNKGRRKWRREEARKKRKGSCARTNFYEHLALSLTQTPVCIRNSST